jgi:hypothetical protein
MTRLGVGVRHRFDVNDQMGAVVCNLVFLFDLFVVLVVFHPVADGVLVGISIGDHVEYRVWWIFIAPDGTSLTCGRVNWGGRQSVDTVTY